MPRRRRAVAALTLAAGLLTGCSTFGGGIVSDPAAELAARPRAEEMIDRYEGMQQRIRDQLNAELGPFEWEERSAGTRAPCGGEFSNSGGARVYLPRWGFGGPISDADWARAKQIIGQITAEFGFISPTMQIDEPGHHETSAADPQFGAQYSLSTRDNTTLAVITGCHLPAG